MLSKSKHGEIQSFLADADNTQGGHAAHVVLRIRIMHRALLLLVIWLAAIGSAYSQQPAVTPEAKQKARSYTFVSPNTRENLTLAEALLLLNSREEFKLINQIRRLSRCLRLKPLVMRTIGSWTDGAEHSTLFRADTDKQTLRYADARLGKFGRQKSVLYFRQDDSGAGMMYVLRVAPGRRSLFSISKTLDRNGVAFRTLVPRTRRRMFIYVVDLNNELRDKIVRAARQLGAVMRMIKGSGEFIGDDTDRDKARQVFAEEIKKYEDENPVVARRCSL